MPHKVVTRFPPSPTGFLHIGRVRTALFNFLFTRKNKGKMILRIEDTDKERSKKEYQTDIIESLKWLGIAYDDGPYRQSERSQIYKKYLKKMVDNGQAYISKEIPHEKGGREEVIRFKNPNKKITFTDLIRGEITFDTIDLKDFVIARNMEDPLYHLAVVVDDFEMGVTHIVRGDDGISNTPRQILIQEAIGAPLPVYAHIPLILAPDKSKLSSRHGAIGVSEYRKEGYLPEALLNYLALLGWNPGTEQELFTIKELIEAFDISKIQKSGAIFNIEKLRWFNKKYIEKLDQKDFLAQATPFITPNVLTSPIPKLIPKLVPLLQEKISFFAQIPELFANELSFINPLPAYDENKLNWKEEKNTKTHLQKTIEIVSEINEKDFTKEKIKEKIWPYAEEKGRGNVLWPMRYALSGQDRSPDPFIIADILGKKETLQRLTFAHDVLKKAL